ncbi:unnamed protein product [Lampetra fluviatilis]
MPVVFAVICLFGLTGNGLVVFTLLRSPRLGHRGRRGRAALAGTGAGGALCGGGGRAASGPGAGGGGSAVPDIFMLNLALADLLFLLCMPLLSHQLLGHSSWRFGAQLCRLIVSLDAATQFGSTYLLTALTLDRYLATVRPLGALSLRLRRPRTAAFAIVALWLLALLSATPYWLYVRLLPEDDEACSIVLPDQERDIYWFTLYQFVLGFALPLLIISAAYWRILQRLHSAIVPAGHNRGVHARTRKVTCFAIAICIVFFVCWAPFYALQLLQLQSSLAPSGSDAFLRAYNVAISLCYANSCLNPFVYMAMCAAFRRRVAAAACSCRRRAHGGADGVGATAAGRGARVERRQGGGEAEREPDREMESLPKAAGERPLGSERTEGRRSSSCAGVGGGGGRCAHGGGEGEEEGGESTLRLESVTDEARWAGAREQSSGPCCHCPLSLEVRASTGARGGAL